MGYESAHNAIRSRLSTNWSATTISYPNVEFRPPQGDVSWIRLTIQDGDSFQASMGAAANIYRHPGAIIVNIFTPLNQGDKLALQYADSISAIFRSWQDNGSGIRCGAPQVRQLGPDDKWYHVTVSVPFERDTAF